MTRNSGSPAVPPQRLSNDAPNYVQRHLRLGWWLILAFLSLGIVLEGLHAFKAPWYLDATNEARRLMWTLAHAHGTLLGLLHIAFAATFFICVRQATGLHAVASKCLTAASLLLPFGFLLGGIYTYGGDPGHGIMLVPVGAVLLLVAVFVMAWSVSGRRRDD
jgi:hypothetical protein